MTVEESAAEEIGQREEKPEEAVPDNSGQEADSVAATEEMAMADALVKEVCEEIEHADEETELEKEVGKIMTKQNETVMTGEVLDETAVITQGMKVNGDVSSQGSMEVLGTIKGNIDILGKLNISGEVEGNSNAAEVFADSAKITGDIHATSSVKVGQSSVIIGNIYATSAVIAGAVKGDIDVQGPVILDTSAIVMGNIKSKSVQINNGAVIEGMCSQCYADVNPASFFQDLNK
ncbi:MAG: polymer-forming cytoskeletal protein [Lachnospiraceae bacterium]|nr:polymer-forming cytoskeletal protein [Lachnospiraceae bacterium]